VAKSFTFDIFALDYRPTNSDQSVIRVLGAEPQRRAEAAASPSVTYAELVKREARNGSSPCVLFPGVIAGGAHGRRCRWW
jgi:hypothetical protein